MKSLQQHYEGAKGKDAKHFSGSGIKFSDAGNFINRDDYGLFIMEILSDGVWPINEISAGDTYSLEPSA